MSEPGFSRTESIPTGLNCSGHFPASEVRPSNGPAVHLEPILSAPIPFNADGKVCFLLVEISPRVCLIRFGSSHLEAARLFDEELACVDPSVTLNREALSMHMRGGVLVRESDSFLLLPRSGVFIDVHEGDYAKITGFLKQAGYSHPVTVQPADPYGGLI